MIELKCYSFYTAATYGQTTQNTEALESMKKEEEEFTKQYDDWLKQYDDWKEQNKGKIAILQVCKC